MTRSIFDPTGGEPERSGSRFLPPTADNASHMPPDVTDGEVGEAESQELRAIAGAAARAADRTPEVPEMPPAAGEEDEYDH